MTSIPLLHAAGETWSRPLGDEEDWWRVRRLLLSLYPLTPTDSSWDVRRWDGRRFHRENSALDAAWSATVRLWFADSERLVGAAHPEEEGTIWLQVHPDYRHLETEMLGWAESALAIPMPDPAQRQLRAFAYEYDSVRLRLLTELGYARTAEFGVVRRLRLGEKVLPLPELDHGYLLRTTRPADDGDCQRMALLLNRAFGRTIHSAAEYRNFSTHSPSFRHDLNLVAEAGDGSLAAHVGVTYVETNRCGIFEPVCTHPDHRRHGLARTLMFEGLRRLKGLGATDVYVGTGDDVAANQLYEAIGFTEAYKGEIWRKVW